MNRPTGTARTGFARGGTEAPIVPADAGAAVQQVVAALQSLRVNLAANENTVLHACIGSALCTAGIPHMHERTIGRLRLDFLTLSGVAIEAKRLRPHADRVAAQMLRYAECSAVDGLVLVVERAIPLPESLCGKPVEQVSTQALWGISV